MAGMSKPLRPLQRGVSNVAGGIKLEIWTIDQFTADTEWPKRSDCATGTLSIVPPILSGEKTARVIFDLEKGVKPKANGKGPSTNKVYDHSFEGATVSGYTAENNEALNNIYNKPIIAILTQANGQRIVLGSTYKPLNLEDDYDGGAVSGDPNATVLKAMSIQPLDFRPPILATGTTIATETIPEYD